MPAPVLMSHGWQPVQRAVQQPGFQGAQQIFDLLGGINPLNQQHATLARHALRIHNNNMVAEFACAQTLAVDSGSLP